MDKKYKIIGIGSNDSYYCGHPEFIGLVGKFKFQYNSVSKNLFSVGLFIPDNGQDSIYFLEVQLEEIKENKEMIINIDGVRFEGNVNDVYNILEKIGLQDRLTTYTSSSKGNTLICEMDTRHIRNALLKMWRESPSSDAIKARNMVSFFLADDLDDYLSEYTNTALASALRCIQPLIPNLQFHYLLKELEIREDDD